ncbi:actyltransferase-like protein [Novymonas esmeraldas]|uniref:Actyltransferase-like protein n=1 Tax=Novymonas esmeraldas TaxID=1808958 RepID=A0AAW0ENC9_9TRYP
MSSSGGAGESRFALHDSATEALWTKLEEVQKLLEHQPDAKELFTRYTVVRSVVGEVKPVFPDAVRLRVKVFCDEQGFAAEREWDDTDPVSMHVVAYFNYTLFTEEMQELAVQARLLRSIGMEGSGLRFQRRRRSTTSTADGEAVSPGGSSDGAPSVHLPVTESKKYRPATLIPVGTLRLRRVSKAAEAGTLTEVVAKIERVCVVKSVRRFDVGRVLMRAAENIARDAFHVRWAILYAQVISTNFYTKIGYVLKDGRVFMVGPSEHVVMVRCLADASI